MYEPPEDAERAADPHERKHGRAQAGADVQPGLRRDHVPEDDEHDGGNDGRGGGEQRGDEGPDDEGQLPPARVERHGREEDGDGIHAGAEQEEAEHAVARDLDEVQDAVDVGWQGDGSPC